MESVQNILKISIIKKTLNMQEKLMRYCKVFILAENEHAKIRKKNKLQNWFIRAITTCKNILPQTIRDSFILLPFTI